MDAPPTAEDRAASADRPAAFVLIALAAWAVAVPWLGRALGLELDVPTRLEIVDHVMPGLLVLACGAVLLHPRAAGPAGGVARLCVTGVACLAGFWITATHWVLVPEAIDGVSPWGAALLHLSAGPPITLLTMWMLVVGAGR